MKKTLKVSNCYGGISAIYLFSSLVSCGSVTLLPNKEHQDRHDESQLAAAAIRPAASSGEGEKGARPLTKNEIVESKFPLVLMYHDVIAGAPGADDVTPENFVKQLDWLQKNKFQTISMDQYSAYKNKKLTKQDLPANPVLLTFDDGYKGVINIASKELAKRNFKATLFVHTAFVGSTAGRAKMTWEDYNSLETKLDGNKNPLFRVYSHTVSHPVAPNGLASLDLANLQRELKDSKKKLEEKLTLKLPRNYIAWPQGNYDTQVIAEAVLAGYIGAMAVGSPIAEVKVKDVAHPINFQHGRVGVGKSLTSIELFATRIKNWSKAQ